MCMFQGRLPDGTPELTEAKARVGYRTFRVLLGHDGSVKVHSPIQWTRWVNPVLGVSRFHFGRRALVGIYAHFANRNIPYSGFHIDRRLVEYGCIATAKVALFGKVAIYEPSVYANGGYRAQRCRILEMSIPPDAPRKLARAIKSQSPQWRDVKVTRGNLS